MNPLQMAVMKGKQNYEEYMKKSSSVITEEVNRPKSPVNQPTQPEASVQFSVTKDGMQTLHKKGNDIIKNEYQPFDISKDGIRTEIKQEDSDNKIEQKFDQIKEEIMNDTSDKWNRQFCLRIIGQDRKGIHLKKLIWEIKRNPVLKKNAEDYYKKLMEKK